MYVILEPFSFHGRTPACALAIACATVLPSTILGASLTTVTTFVPKNVSKTNQIDDTAFNADVCMQYDTSTIVTNTCVIVILNP